MHHKSCFQFIEWSITLCIHLHGFHDWWCPNWYFQYVPNGGWVRFPGSGVTSIWYGWCCFNNTCMGQVLVFCPLSVTFPLIYSCTVGIFWVQLPSSSWAVEDEMFHYWLWCNLHLDDCGLIQVDHVHCLCCYCCLPLFGTIVWDIICMLRVVVMSGMSPLIGCRAKISMCMCHVMNTT